MFKVKLDPTIRCGLEFDRHDAETVAARVASNNQCDFWHTAHEAMRQILKPSNGDKSDRVEALHRLADAATARPFDRERLEAARKFVIDTQGEATLVEAAGVIALMDAYTKVTEATGRPAWTSVMVKVMKLLLGSIRSVYEFVSRVIWRQ